ncbi:MAG: polysaccharide biosynthesis C-terminal domain-containing protein [Treponema sp.]|jgi:putative MATE family efflux protein|nr:polysaccharide biosynthesis C-terminal domain-containing protein [Treponema sp.]
MKLPNPLGPAEFYRQAVRIAAPVMLQQFIMSMVSLIDNFMVAGLGDMNMAAVNVSNQLNFIHLVVVNTVCGAGGIYLAQFKGAGDQEGMRQAYRFKFLLSAAVSALYFLLCWTLADKMLGMMILGNAARGEIIPAGERYIRLLSCTLFPMALSMAVGTSYRETGKPGVPLLISAGATVVNTAGNWLLIYGRLGAPALGVTGAAISTIIARYLEAGAFLVYARRGRAPFFVGFTGVLRVKGKLIREVLVKSGMMFLSELSWITSETIMTALYNSRGGAETVAGMAAGFTIANIFFLLFAGVWTTTAVLVGGSLGAGRLEEARRRARWIQSGAVAAGAALALPGALFALAVIPLVFRSLTAGARSISTGLVLVILVYLPLWTLLNAIWAISRAGGDTRTGMYADVTVNTFLFVPACFILALRTTIGPVPLFALVKLSDLFKYAVARHFLRQERWVRNLTEPRDPPRGPAPP